MTKTHLTKEWYQKLIEELQLLKNEKLPNTLEKLKEAIAQWDISENAEYDTAMGEKELIEARINEIQHILENVEIIEHDTNNTEIKYWSVVVLEDEKWTKSTWTIVGSWEVDVLANTISFQSPLWHAIRWKSVGDTIQVKAPQKRYTMKIVEIR